MLKSYIVKERDTSRLFEWAKSKNFMGRWMPESHELYRLFLGEFFWSPAYRYFNLPYYHHAGWTRGDNGEIPAEVWVSVEEYMCEGSGFDCSVDESYRIFLPTSLIANGMKLNWNGVEGHWFDQGGDLVAFDPSVNENGPGCLLIEKAKFLRFLRENRYGILWTFLGEKGDYTGGVDNPAWRKRGRLELSGAYTFIDGQLTGTMTPSFTQDL